MSEKLHTGHRQRVKNKFKEFGLDAFEDHELLEFLLFFGIPYKDTNPIAHKLINKYGKLSEVFNASLEDLKEFEGMTDNAAVLIKALPEIVNRYKIDKGNYKSINCLRDCVKYLKPLMSDLTFEQFILISLDSKNAIIKCSKINRGTVNSVHVDLRSVHEQAVKDRAVSVVIAHNHPAGTKEPSDSDIRVTKTIISSLAFLEINVLDHIIISGNDYFSFKKEGSFDKYKAECPQYFLSKFAESNEQWIDD